MIERIIDWCASNRFLVFTGTVVLTVWGIWAMTRTPLAAPLRNGSIVKLEQKPYQAITLRRS